MVNSSSYFQVGGSLPANSPSYVFRQADHELYQALLQREYCYVLNARQMGKSSLRVQTMEKLQSLQVACTEIELTGIGSQEITASQWYGGIIQELISGFQIRFDRRDWFQEHDHLAPVQRLSRFIETVLLKQIQQEVVIFIDEIDNILSLSFPVDEFFALLRHCFDRRSTQPDYRRLTFCLLGVATPSDLIQSPEATPFNIGRPIDLTGFKLEEIAPLEQGLSLSGMVGNSQQVMEAILAWTGGQPFMTQKLCRRIIEGGYFIEDGREIHQINQIVHQQILENWVTQDEPEHLRTIEDRATRLSSERRQRSLHLYLEILRRGSIRSRRKSEYFSLRLTGLVVQRNHQLVVGNLIYRSVFDEAWVSRQLQDLSDLPDSEPEPEPISSLLMPQWLTPVISIILVLGVMGVRALGWLQPWELQAFDHLMRRMPHEEPDPRLLIVAVDEVDIQTYGDPLPDHLFAQLLERMVDYQAKAIGLDIFRDRPIPPGETEFARHLLQTESLIVVCSMATEPTVDPPLLLRGQNQRVGFVDLFPDTPYLLDPSDTTIRRYLLSHEGFPEDRPCSTPYSLALQAVGRYFDFQGIEQESEDWVIDEVRLRRLQSRSGGYQTLDAGGNQLLVRYRNTPEPDQIAQRVSLRQALDPDGMDPEWVRDRVVLVGMAAVSARDPHTIPLGRVEGVTLHSHVISQILSTVEEGRPMIIWLPVWGEGVWIGVWTLLGSYVASGVRGARRGMVWAGLGLSIYSSCWLGFLWGIWFPLIPTLMALGLTIVWITFCYSRSLKD